MTSTQPAPGTATPQAPAGLSGSKCGFQLDCPPSAFLSPFPGDSAVTAAFKTLWGLGDN